MSKYAKYMDKAEEILQDSSKWINDEKWVTRQEFYLALLPFIDTTEACRQREHELNRRASKKEESLTEKVNRGRRRIAQIIENRLAKEFDPTKKLIRLCKTTTRRYGVFSIHYVYEFDGKNQSLQKWAEEVGITTGMLIERLRNGWSIGDALTTPKKIKQASRRPSTPTSS